MILNILYFSLITSLGDVRGLAETGFVSEEFPASSEDIKEVQEGMKKLGIKTDQGECCPPMLYNTLFRHL